MALGAQALIWCVTVTIQSVCKRVLGSDSLIVLPYKNSSKASSCSHAPQLLKLAMLRLLTHRVVVKTEDLGEMGQMVDGTGNQGGQIGGVASLG